jgi:hypothetical protein
VEIYIFCVISCANQGNQPKVRQMSTYPAKPRGLAPEIRRVSLKYPELNKSEIARKVGCTPQNVGQVLSTFLSDTTPEELRDYQENQADVFDTVAYKLLGSITQEKIEKTKPMEAITGAAILIDKARLVRGQATGINVNVMLDLVEAIRAKQNNK